MLAPLPIAIDEFPPAAPETPAKESVPLAVAPAPMAVARSLLLLELYPIAIAFSPVALG